MSYLELLGAVSLVALCALLWKLSKKWNRYAKAAAAVCIVGLGIVAAGLSLSFLFAHLMCGEYLLAPVEAPDHATIAQVTEFDCGATAPFTSYVRVRTTRSIAARIGLAKWSNVFTVVHDPRLISITWEGPKQLVIRHPAPYRQLEYTKCDSVWNDVKIRCEVYTPNEGKALPTLPEPNRWCW